jgi:hypothetical protein
MLMWPKVTGIVELQNLDQVVVAGVETYQAMLQKECPTLDPSLGRLLSQRVHNFMDSVESAVAPEELCRQRLGAPTPDPPIGEHLNGDAKGLGDFTNGHGVPRGALVICHRAASTSARLHSEARG